MKSIVFKTIFNSFILFFIFSLFLMAIFFYSYPIESWSDLWSRKLLGLPFLLFVPAVTTVFGATVGIIVSFTWKRQLSMMEDALDSLHEGGNYQVEEKLTNTSEFMLVVNKVKEVENYIHEQTKRTQKLISDRVQDQEKQMEKVISEERNRLARELHDSVSQELFAASMMVSAINESNPSQNEVTARQLQQVEAMIQQAQLEMRALLLHLRPVALKDKSLKEGMKQLLDELKQKVPIDVTWKMEPVELSRGVEDHLFRILQESVSNTLRHSKAHALEILLIERDGFVILRVTDDGVGFDVNETQASSYGLTNMKERAAEIGAAFRIISIPDKGTRLEVRVPIIDTEGDRDD